MVYTFFGVSINTLLLWEFLCGSSIPRRKLFTWSKSVIYWVFIRNFKFRDYMGGLCPTYVISRGPKIWKFPRWTKFCCRTLSNLFFFKRLFPTHITEYILFPTHFLSATKPTSVRIHFVNGWSRRITTCVYFFFFLNDLIHKDKKEYK